MAGASHYPMGSVAPPQTTAGASAPPPQSPPGISRLASGQDMYGPRSDVPPNYSTLPGLSWDSCCSSVIIFFTQCVVQEIMMRTIVS